MKPFAFGSTAKTARTDDIFLLTRKETRMIIEAVRFQGEMRREDGSREVETYNRIGAGLANVINEKWKDE